MPRSPLDASAYEYGMRVAQGQSAGMTPLQAQFPRSSGSGGSDVDTSAQQSQLRALTLASKRETAATLGRLRNLLSRG